MPLAHAVMILRGLIVHSCNRIASIDQLYMNCLVLMALSFVYLKHVLCVARYGEGNSRLVGLLLCRVYVGCWVVVVIGKSI